MSEAETIRCSWCGKARKPSAYAGDDHFPRLADICQWCRGVETRRARGEEPEWVEIWLAKELDLQGQADQIEQVLKGKHLRDGEEEAGCKE